ncbi:hypothetical protein ABIE56_002399 [Luteibacter sp. 621]|uniref:hypothetical protein n=1 Tax=Luteibacter sp. 621 TaxID=3373916 RepID=UPI003D25F60F
MLASFGTGELKYVTGNEPPVKYVVRWKFRGWRKDNLGEYPVIEEGPGGGSFFCVVIDWALDGDQF